jgi:hypothetical protein
MKTFYVNPFQTTVCQTMRGYMKLNSKIYKEVFQITIRSSVKTPYDLADLAIKCLGIDN